MNGNNENLDKSLDALKSGIGKQEVRKQSQQYFDDMEWWMLVAIMKEPEIISEIAEIIPDPKVLTGYTDDTPHSLIYRAITNLWDDGLNPDFETLYAECEKIRVADPLIKSYSRNSIIELDFQATIRGRRTATEMTIENDHNRIRGKFCAEQVLRRK